MRDKLGAVAFCLLFAVVFGGVGVGASWMIGRTVHDGMRAKDWVLVKASVDAFDRGQVSYRYTFQGREYKGDRLGSEILGGTDNIDSWHEDMAERLSAARRDGKPITVFVNPDNPAESMVDRAIRWNLMLFMLPFALGFGGVGVGALWFLVHTLRGGSDERPVKARARVVAGGGGGVLGLWVFAFFWNVISVPIALLVLPEVIRNEEWIGLLVLLFPFFGVLMIWGAISQTIARFRRGATPSAPAPEPAASVAHDTSTLFARGMIRDDPAAAAPAIAPAAASSIRSFDAVLGDDPLPAPPVPATAPSTAEPDLEGVLKLFDKNAKLTPQQRAALAKLTPEQKAMIGKLSNWAPSMKKWIIGLIGLVFALQFLPSILSLFRNP